MACDIVHIVRLSSLDDEPDGACYLDTVTDTVFGPLFEDYDQAAAFTEWLSVDDPREILVSELMSAYQKFCASYG